MRCSRRCGTPASRAPSGLARSPPAVRLRATALRRDTVDRSATADLSFLAVAAGVMAAGYGLDLAGLPIVPWLLLLVAGAGGVTARVLLQPRADPWWTLVVVAAFAYAMWIASPAFLPVTNGPDVVH